MNVDLIVKVDKTFPRMSNDTWKSAHAGDNIPMVHQFIIQLILEKIILTVLKIKAHTGTRVLDLIMKGGG